MNLFKKIKLLWFPDKETRKKLEGIAVAYTAQIASEEAILKDLTASKTSTENALERANLICAAKLKRLRDLENCFEDKSRLYDDLNDLHSQMKSAKSQLDSAYRDLKKNKASKDDFYDWSNRQRSMWNGYSGRRGRKLRNHYNPASIFDRYSRQDLESYKSNIASAKRMIGRYKSERDSTYSEIQKTKRMIGDAKKLCAYAKTPEAKKEKRELKDRISAQNNLASQFSSTLKKQQVVVADQEAVLTKIRRAWRDDRKKIKLAQ